MALRTSGEKYPISYTSGYYANTIDEILVQTDENIYKEDSNNGSVPLKLKTSERQPNLCHVTSHVVLHYSTTTKLVR